MAIKIFSTSHLSILPSQAVSLIRLNIFKRLKPEFCEYWTTADDFNGDPGSIRIIETRTKSRLLRFSVRFFWLWKIKPEIILFTGEPMEILFLLFHPRKSKLVLHLNGPVPYHLKDYPYRNSSFDLLWRSVVFFIKRADCILTISQYAADSLKPFKLSAKIDVIYNGVDLKQFYPGKRDKLYFKKKFGLDDSKRIFSFIGALILRKRPQVFVELAKRFPEIQFVLVGRNNPETDLSTEISQTKNLFWVKEMSRDDVAILLASCDLFIFPSLFEGFGMVVAEAMASGCPVIASSGSGPEELLTNECGIIVQTKDSREQELKMFESLIKKSLADPEKLKKMSLAARKQAVAKFGWDDLAVKWRQRLEKYV